MKNTLLIIINLLLIGLIAISGFYLVKVVQNQQLSNFIKEKQTQLAAKENQDLQVGNIGYSHVTAYFPKDSEGKRIAPLEEIINQKVKNLLGEKKPLGEIRQLVFVSATEMPTNIPTVRRTEITSQSYKVAGFNISKLDNIAPQVVLLTVDNQRFTLANLFTNLEQARAIFASRVWSELKAKQVTGEQIEQNLLDFNSLQLQDLDFSYEVSQVTIKLPEEQVGLSHITVDISSFFDIVNSQYLTEKDLQIFETYQAEKQRKLQENMVALTFDDGPNPATTPVILDILKKYNVKATFFVLGKNLAGNEEIIKRIVAEGHEVANHSWSHPNFVKLSPEQVKQEIEQTQTVIEGIIGKKPVMARPPYGAVNQSVMDAMNLPAMYWSIDTLDWQSRNPQAILNVVKANVSPGSIILMHDIHQPTVESIEPVLQYLQEQGYSCGTMTDLLGTNLNPQHIYYDRDTSQSAG